MTTSASLIWKRRIGSLYRWLPKTKSRKIILIYHSVDGGPLATGLEQFKSQMAWLAEHANVVSLDTLLSVADQKADAAPQVALSFDDGYRTVHDVVAPILAEYGFPATIYLNTGHIREAEHEASDANQGHYPDEQFMNWDDVLDLQRQGWTIGSHGVAHLDLTRQPATHVERELADSKWAIESRLGQTCRHFSYTWGRYTPALQDAVKDAGYASAASGMHGPPTSNSDPYALPRIDVRDEYELRDFADVVTGRWDFLGLKQRLMQRLA